MKVILLWIVDVVCGLAVLTGVVLVGWNALEIYYLVTGTVQPGFEQPPIAVAVALLIFGAVLFLGGWALHKKLQSTSL